MSCCLLEDRAIKFVFFDSKGGSSFYRWQSIFYRLLSIIIDNHLYFCVSEIFISPQKGRYNYTGRVVKCCVWPLYEVIFSSGIGKYRQISIIYRLLSIICDFLGGNSTCLFRSPDTYRNVYYSFDRCQPEILSHIKRIKCRCVIIRLKNQSIPLSWIADCARNCANVWLEFTTFNGFEPLPDYGSVLLKGVNHQEN